MTLRTCFFSALGTRALGLFSVLMLTGALHAAVPRVAIWNPEKPATHARVQLFEDHLDRAAESLRRSGADVTRLTVEQFADPAQFNATRFDLAVFSGELVPGVVIPALRSFAEAGGVVMNLGGKIPFINRLARRADSTWNKLGDRPQIMHKFPY